MNEKIIGITGGLATGKSTVSDYLERQYDLKVLDADLYAREATEKNNSILGEIVNRYGQKILLDSGQLDRLQLAQIIFNQDQEKKWLENLIHPYVKKRFLEDLHSSNDDVIVFVVPLLFEVEMQDMVDETWLVTCSPQQQIERVIKRNSLSKEQALARINNQWDLDTKRNLADLIIENTEDLNYLYKQIDRAIALSKIINNIKKL
ncbi:MAG: dephospho-CoA kinase [Cyanobacteriota bacterium ELA615]